MRLKSATELEKLFGVLKETLTFQPPSDFYLANQQILEFEFSTLLFSNQFWISAHFDATILNWFDLVTNLKSNIKVQFENPNLKWTLAALRRRPQMPQISF